MTGGRALVMQRTIVTPGGARPVSGARAPAARALHGAPLSSTGCSRKRGLPGAFIEFAEADDQAALDRRHCRGARAVARSRADLSRGRALAGRLLHRLACQALTTIQELSMLGRSITAAGETWRAFPSGFVTQYDHDEFGFMFVRGHGRRPCRARDALLAAGRALAGTVVCGIDRRRSAPALQRIPAELHLAGSRLRSVSGGAAGAPPTRAVSGPDRGSAHAFHGVRWIRIAGVNWSARPKPRVSRRSRSPIMTPSTAWAARAAGAATRRRGHRRRRAQRDEGDQEVHLLGLHLAEIAPIVEPAR